MRRWMDGWMDDRWMDRRIRAWVGRCMNRWVNGNTHSRELLSAWLPHPSVNNRRSFQLKEA